VACRLKYRVDLGLGIADLGLVLNYQCLVLNLSSEGLPTQVHRHKGNMDLTIRLFFYADFSENEARHSIFGVWSYSLLLSSISVLASLSRSRKAGLLTELYWLKSSRLPPPTRSKKKKYALNESIFLSAKIIFYDAILLTGRI